MISPMIHESWNELGPTYRPRLALIRSRIRFLSGFRGEGFTLLETIVALALIVGAMAGPFTLATRGIFAAKFSKSQLVALNLAQEGIELIRHARENNLVDDDNQAVGVTWRGLPPGPCPATCIQLADGSYQPDVFTDSTAELQATLGGQIPLSREPTTGLYYQDPLLNNLVPFTRVVRICSTSSCVADPANQVRVTATLTWTESNIPRQVKLEEVLYNWQ